MPNTKKVRTDRPTVNPPPESRLVCVFCGRLAQWEFPDGPRCSWHLHGAAPAPLTRSGQIFARARRP